MAEVELIHVPLTRTELLTCKAELDAHIADCCGAQDGTCGRLEQLGEVEFLLSTEAGDV